MIEIGRTKVSQYWEDNQHPITGRTRSWIQPVDWPIEWNEPPHQVMEDILKDYPPPLRQGHDILRWGRNGDGNFHIKEAYQEALGLGNEPKRLV
jgi:hypothetical protein